MTDHRRPERVGNILRTVVPNGVPVPVQQPRAVRPVEAPSPIAAAKEPEIRKPELADVLDLFPFCVVCGVEIKRGKGGQRAGVLPGTQRAVHETCYREQKVNEAESL